MQLRLPLGLLAACQILTPSFASHGNPLLVPNFQAVYNARFQLTPDGSVTRKVISGKGFHSLVGASTSLFEGTMKPAPEGEAGYVIEGTTTLTDSAGERLLARTTGRVLPVPGDAGMVELDYYFTFDGGSGRFAYASGNAHVMGIAQFKDQVSGTATWCMEGRLDLGFRASYNHTFRLSPVEGSSSVFNKEISGRGLNTLIGESAARFLGTVDLGAAPYAVDGTTTFTDSDAHVLTARTVGRIHPDTKDSQLVKLDYDYEFTGGTGKFEGATGRAHVFGSAVFENQTSGNASWFMEGGLSLVPQTPAVRMETTVKGMRLRWNQGGGHWGVESSRNLSHWNGLDVAVEGAGLKRSVSVPGDGVEAFFRLRRKD